MRSFKLKSHLLFLISLTFIGYSFIFTGPSSLESLIRPVSMNAKGEILCRTKFTQNKMGAHRPMKITYGFGLISPDTFMQLETYLLDPEMFADEKEFYSQETYWDSILNTPFTPNDLGLDASNFTQGFNSINGDIEACKIDEIFTLEEFEQKKHIDLEKNPQKALNGAYSETYFEEGKIHLLYDFGYVGIIENMGGDGLSFGADFSYFNGWTNDAGEAVNMGFDVIEVTGMLYWQ